MARYGYDPLTQRYGELPEAKPVSIRLPISVIETLKKESSHDMFRRGRGYQTLAVQILRAWCEDLKGPEKYDPKPAKKKRSKK